MWLNTGIFMLYKLHLGFSMLPLFAKVFMSHNYSVDFGSKLRLCLLCLTINSYGLTSALAVEVIINTGGSEELLQEHSDLRSIFSMRTRYWANGEKIRVFVLPDDTALHKAFVKQRLHMFPYQLRRTWDRMTYTGTGQPPVTVDSVSKMLEKIKHTKYSIGYIDRRIEDEDEAIYFFDAQ